MSALYVLFPGQSKQFFTVMGQQLIYLPILVGALPNFIFDVQNLDQVIKNQFIEHFDSRNGGYIVGKLASNGFLVYALVQFFEEFKADPKLFM